MINRDGTSSGDGGKDGGIPKPRKFTRAPLTESQQLNYLIFLKKHPSLWNVIVSARLIKENHHKRLDRFCEVMQMSPANNYRQLVSTFTSIRFAMKHRLDKLELRITSYDSGKFEKPVLLYRPVEEHFDFLALQQLGWHENYTRFINFYELSWPSLKHAKKTETPQNQTAVAAEPSPAPTTGEESQSNTFSYQNNDAYDFEMPSSPPPPSRQSTIAKPIVSFTPAASSSASLTCSANQQTPPSPNNKTSSAPAKSSELAPTVTGNRVSPMQTYSTLRPHRDNDLKVQICGDARTTRQTYYICITAGL